MRSIVPRVPLIMLALLAIIVASLVSWTSADRVSERLRHRGRAIWKQCPSRENRSLAKKFPARKIESVVDEKQRLDGLMDELLTAAKGINEIMRDKLDKPSENAPLLITVFTGCPDGTSGSMVEILQLLSAGETPTAALPGFLKIDSIAGESDEGGGGGGTSGGCYDEDLGVCCEGECPC